MVSSESLNKVNITIYSTIWILISIVQAVILHYFYNLGGYFAIADSLVFNGLFALLSSSIWYIVRFTDFSKSSIPSFILNHFFSMLCLIAIWLALGFFLSRTIFKDVEYNVFLGQSLAWRSIMGI